MLLQGSFPGCVAKFPPLQVRRARVGPAADFSPSCRRRLRVGRSRRRPRRRLLRLPHHPRGGRSLVSPPPPSRATQSSASRPMPFRRFACGDVAGAARVRMAPLPLLPNAVWTCCPPRRRLRERLDLPPNHYSTQMRWLRFVRDDAAAARARMHRRHRSERGLPPRSQRRQADARPLRTRLRSARLSTLQFYPAGASWTTTRATQCRLRRGHLEGRPPRRSLPRKIRRLSTQLPPRRPVRARRAPRPPLRRPLQRRLPHHGQRLPPGRRGGGPRLFGARPSRRPRHEPRSPPREAGAERATAPQLRRPPRQHSRQSCPSSARSRVRLKVTATTRVVTTSARRCL